MLRTYIVGVVAIVCVIVATSEAPAQNPRSIVLPPGVTSVKTLSQNWSDAESSEFYNKPQGTQLVPYSWFLALEQPGSSELFRDPGNIQRLGYIARSSDPGNKDGLPIGFTRDGIHLGMTCAACHTQLIVKGSEGILVDGAPTLGDLEQILRSLVASMDDTLATPAKFDRFADRVLGPGAGTTSKDDLKADLKEIRDFRDGYNKRNLSTNNAAHPRFGPGRVDAIGAIFNEVSTLGAKLPTNHLPSNAPVSYPFLWDTPQHDRIQWNGSVENTESALAIPLFGTRYLGALGRNAGEVLGVFGKFEVAPDGLLPKGYPSTVVLKNLIEIEDSVRRLWSPQWPEGSLGSIDPTLKTAGKTLFLKHCVDCHQPIDRTNENRTVKAWLDHSVGTDESMAKNFLTKRVNTGAFQGQYIQIPGLSTFGSRAAQAELLVHSVQRVLIGGGREAFPVPFNIAAPVDILIDNAATGRRLSGRFQSLELVEDKLVSGQIATALAEGEMKLRQDGGVKRLTNFSPPLNSFLASDGTIPKIEGLSLSRIESSDSSSLRLAAAAPVQFIYKGRPLNGIWATAPYLHNGSVPSLDELLKPAAQRVKKFTVGSRNFDSVGVGLEYGAGAGSFEFDTQLPGNSNAGHEYGGAVFTDEERKALVEYMKSL